MSLDSAEKARSLRYKHQLRDTHLDDSLALSRGVALLGESLCGERSTGQAELNLGLRRRASTLKPHDDGGWRTENGTMVVALVSWLWVNFRLPLLNE
jgi:hypothetical protein